MDLAVSGAVAGVAFGFVLARTNLCFHSMWRGIYERRYDLAKMWILGVAITIVGIAVIFSLGTWDQLDRSLARAIRTGG